MDLMELKVIADSKLWPVLGVGRDKGRRDLKKLEAQGLVSPRRTLTGRSELSFRDLVELAKYYELDSPK